MSRRLDIKVMDIDIFLFRTHFQRDKVRILINLAYLAFRDTLIYVYSRSRFFRGRFDEIEGAISRIIAFLDIAISPGLLDR